MEYTQEEIVKALKVIKSVCSDHRCKDCPFSYDEGDCAINYIIPSEWEIEDPDAAWHAIR